MDISKPFLLIPDLQIPFENHKALYFCSYLKRHYGIPDENILNLGDEVDQLKASGHGPSPDSPHTANSEIKAAKIALKEWVAVFPKMLVCTSNHGMRWIRKATNADIPSQMIRAYQDVLELPDTWRYADEWTIPTPHPFKIVHGMQFGGQTPYRKAAEISDMSVAFGHLHSSQGICHIMTYDNKKRWAFNVGCLIDIDGFAFQYGKYNKFKPNLGAGVVFNGGTTPVWIPLD